MPRWFFNCPWLYMWKLVLLLVWIFMEDKSVRPHAGQLIHCDSRRCFWHSVTSMITTGLYNWEILIYDIFDLQRPRHASDFGGPPGSRYGTTTEKNWRMIFHVIPWKHSLNLLITQLFRSSPGSESVKQPRGFQTKMYRLYREMTIHISICNSFCDPSLNLLYPDPGFSEHCFKEVCMYFVNICCKNQLTVLIPTRTHNRQYYEETTTLPELSLFLFLIWS